LIASCNIVCFQHRLTRFCCWCALIACFWRVTGLPEFSRGWVKLVNFSILRVQNICWALAVLALGLPSAWADTAQRSDAPTFEQFQTAIRPERDSPNSDRRNIVRWEQETPIIVSIQVGLTNLGLNMDIAWEFEDRILQFAEKVEAAGGPQLVFGGIGLASPESQIVINVGDKDDLSKLGIISTHTHAFSIMPQILRTLRSQGRTERATEIHGTQQSKISHVLISIERGPLSHRCFSEEMLHAMGLSGEFENEVRSVLDAFSTVQYPTELDWALLERLYHPDLSAGQILTKTVFESIFE